MWRIHKYTVTTYYSQTLCIHIDALYAWKHQIIPLTLLLMHAPPWNRKKEKMGRETGGKSLHTACLCLWSNIDDNVTVDYINQEMKNLKRWLRCVAINNMKWYQRSKHVAIWRHISYTVWQSLWDHIDKYVTPHQLALEAGRLQKVWSKITEV